MLLTIVIPAFNCEKTIERAIKSTGVENNKDIEVIVVDNGSKDNTSKVVNELAINNSNIILAKSVNGVSNARNKGIELASADWISFLDADDVFVNNGVKSIINASFNDDSNDIVIFNYLVNSDNIDLDSMIEEKKDTSIIISKMLENPTKFLTVWGKAFRKELIKKEDIFFDTSLIYSEDSEFLIRYLLKCKNIKFNHKYVYQYCLTKNSTVRKYNSKMIYEYEKSISQIKLDLVGNEEYKHSLSIFILMQFNLIMVHNVFASESNNRLKKMKSLCQKNYMKDALSIIGMKDIKRISLVPLVCCKYHFYFLAALIYKLRIIQNKSK